MPPLASCRSPRYHPPSPIAAVFFRRSRLFFREAAFSSGGEGCEWGAKQPTVGESGDKAENEFSGFIPLTVPRKGFSPHIPASRLFVHFHTTMPTSPPNPSSIHQVESIQSVGSVGSIASIPPHKKEHSLLVLPFVRTIINFATEFFEMLTKKQSRHP